ncbi:MAG TPA: zinc ABC transporter substrate-binding protein [Actinobacteria bacterium]|nr:zinc ABC transporter substrate-binding protein [Actinomycetota bacterium]
MKRNKILVFLLSLLVVLGLVFGVAGCKKKTEEASTKNEVESSAKTDVEEKNTKKIKVIVTTSLIENIVKEIGGDNFDVTVMIPPGGCPGHFDIKPEDIKAVASGSLFLKHGWETWAENLIKSANNPNLKVETIAIKGNWMVPTFQIEAVDKIAAVLSGVDKENSDSYHEKAASYKKKVGKVAADAKKRCEDNKLSEISVICAQMQEGFVKWLGFNVVATYGRPDELTPEIIKDLVDKCNDNNVKLVIDNLQSGANVGLQVAQDVGANHIILSNFPGAIEGANDYEGNLNHNLGEVLSNVQ